MEGNGREWKERKGQGMEGKGGQFQFGDEMFSSDLTPSYVRKTNIRYGDLTPSLLLGSFRKGRGEQ